MCLRWNRLNRWLLRRVGLLAAVNDLRSVSDGITITDMTTHSTEWKQVRRALRKANLPEWTTANRNGWSVSDDDDDYVIIRNWEYTVFGRPEFTSDIRTTDRYHEYAGWIAQVVNALTDAGFSPTLAMFDCKWGRFNQHRATYVGEIRVAR